MKTEVMTAESLMALKGGGGNVLTDADATQYPNDINNLSTCDNDLGQCSSKLSFFLRDVVV